VDGMLPKFLLLVTHDPAISQLNFMEFYEAGFVLYLAADFREATALLQQRPIDLLLVDLQLEARDAVGFCHQTKAANSQLKTGLLADQDQPLLSASVDFLVIREPFKANAIQELRNALERMPRADLSDSA
jgi:CheY-like chemotaxis protein